MTLKTMMVSDADILIDTDDFGEIGNYYDKSEDETIEDIDVEILYHDDEVNFETPGEFTVRMADILIKKSDVTRPARGDTFTPIGESAFTILKILRGDAVFHVVLAEQKVRKTLGDIGREQ